METKPPLEAVCEQTYSRRQALILGGGAIAAVADSKLLDVFQPQYDTSPGDQVKPLFDYKVREIKNRFDVIREGMDWSEVPGVSVVPDGLRLSPLDPKIINKRSSDMELQENPPFNAKEFIRTNGDFRITAGIDSYGPVHVQLYSNPPVRQDDFRYEFGRLDCEIGYDKLIIRRWSKSINGSVALEYPIRAGYSRQISVQRSGDRLVLFNDGELLGEFPAEDVFDTGNIWFGLNSTDSPALVHELTFEESNLSQESGLWSMPETIPQKQGSSLQGGVTAAGRDLLIGTEASLWPMFTDRLYASAVFGGDYGIITLGNGLKPQDRNPADGVYEHKFGLSGLRYIEQQRRLSHGHVIYYDKANRKELEKMPTDTYGDKLRIAQYIVDDTQRFAEAFGKYLYSVDVTNEMIDGWGPSVHMRQNVLMRALGMEGVALLFRTAGELMPNVKLGLNEYGFEIDPFRTKAARTMLEYIRAHGGRVDFVGSQTHIYHDASFVNDFAMRYFLREMRQAGVRVHISEMDVTTSRGIVEQAKQFRKVFRYALNDENVKRFSVWGPDDYYGSKAGINLITGRYDPGTGLLLDKDFRETLAMRLLLDEIAAYASER